MSEYSQEYLAFKKEFLDAGHEFQMIAADEYDPSVPDMFAYSYDIHNGPCCVHCGWVCCEHCIRPGEIPICKGKQK